MITRKDLSVIREKINNAVQEIASEYDAKMSIGNISYGGSSENVTNFTTKITCEVGSYTDPMLAWRMERLSIRCLQEKSKEIPICIQECGNRRNA
mgnify:CR=1 FL=1